MSDKKKTKDTTADATKDTTVDETQKSKETVVKKEDILEIGHTLQKLKEMHEANDLNIYKRLNYHVSCGCILYWETISLPTVITHL
jgi:hypoxanthine-guanine phosphoribosyltransferase